MHHAFENDVREAFSIQVPEGMFDSDLGNNEKRSLGLEVSSSVIEAWTWIFNIPCNLSDPNDVFFQVVYQIVLLHHNANKQKFNKAGTAQPPNLVANLANTQYVPISSFC